MCTDKGNWVDYVENILLDKSECHRTVTTSRCYAAALGMPFFVNHSSLLSAAIAWKSTSNTRKYV